MGQKVNPISFRLQISKDWSSRWFAANKKQFAGAVDFKQLTGALQRFPGNLQLLLCLQQGAVGRNHLRDGLRDSGFQVEPVGLLG